MNRTREITAMVWIAATAAIGLLIWRHGNVMPSPNRTPSYQSVNAPDPFDTPEEPLIPTDMYQAAYVGNSGAYPGSY